MGQEACTRHVFLTLEKSLCLSGCVTSTSTHKEFFIFHPFFFSFLFPKIPEVSNGSLNCKLCAEGVLDCFLVSPPLVEGRMEFKP